MQAVVYDATLREGAQGAGASFSLEDKVKIARLLDELGVAYVEAGNPSSNPKDKAFFDRMLKEPLKTAKLVAFGSTCRKDRSPEEDANMKALLMARTDCVAIFGKAWDFHATEILGVSLEENLNMIRQSVVYLCGKGKRVFFDAEHFFDGYKHNPEYAMEVLKTAKEAGAYSLVLCDTNGGCFPHEVQTITQKVVAAFGECIGIHVHNDTGMAGANTVEAVLGGANLVQVTMNGLGERCGNADLFTVVPNLQLKLGYACIPTESMRRITLYCRQFSEIANLSIDDKTAYVGKNAFTHKAGMHIDGVSKNPISFEHISPELVGRSRTFLLSEVAGRMAVIQKAKSIVPEMDKHSPEATLILEKLKELENKGYQFEGAEASFELVIRRLLGLYQPLFTVKNYKAISDAPEGEEFAYAIAEVEVGGEVEINAGKGNGPVNALDFAMRKALERFYPKLKEVYLTDYKVRVLDSKLASASKVRVLIESTDGKATWTTIGVSQDIIQASFLAMVDSIEYKLLKDKE